MDGFRRYNGKRKKSEKDKYHMISLIEFKKQTKKKRDPKKKKVLTKKSKLMVTRGEVGEGWVKEVKGLKVQLPR